MVLSAEKGQRISSVKMVNINNSITEESFNLEIKGVPVLTRVGAILPTGTLDLSQSPFTPTDPETLGVVHETSINPKYGAPIWTSLNVLNEQNREKRRAKVNTIAWPSWMQPKPDSHFALYKYGEITNIKYDSAKTIYKWYGSLVNNALSEITNIFKQQKENKARTVFSEKFIKQIESENRVLPFERMLFFIYSDLVTNEFMAGFLTIDGSPHRILSDNRIPIEVEFPHLRLSGRAINEQRVVEIKRFGREPHKSAVNFTEMVATLAQHLEYADLLETTLYAHTDAAGKRLFKTLGFHVEFYPEDLKKNGEYILEMSAWRFNEIHMRSQVFKTLKKYPFRRPLNLDRTALPDKEIKYFDTQSLPNRIVEAVEEKQKRDLGFRKKYPGKFYLLDPSGSSNLVYENSYDMFYLDTINYSSASKNACKKIFSKASVL
jgi:hypothetical protein